MRYGNVVSTAVCVAVLALAHALPMAAQSPADIYVRDNVSDDGSVPAASGGTSPDIWVRLDGDCGNIAHQAPVQGANATICVRVLNRGDGGAQSIRADVYWAEGGLPTVWPSSWTVVGSPTLSSLAGHSNAVVSTPWSVPTLANLALLVRLDSTEDPVGSGPDSVVPVDIAVNNNNIASLQLQANAPPIPVLGRLGLAAAGVLLAVAGMLAVRRLASG